MTDYQKWCAENPILAEIEQLENLGSIDGELSPADQARLDELYAMREQMQSKPQDAK